MKDAAYVVFDLSGRKCASGILPQGKAVFVAYKDVLLTSSDRYGARCAARKNDGRNDCSQYKLKFFHNNFY